jgi:hypothetical protein
LLKKIINLFSSKKEEDVRSNFRFDVLYIDDLELEIKKTKYKLKEISLVGLSFLSPESTIKSFPKKSIHTCSVIFKKQKIDIQLEVKSITNDLIGCKITTNKDEYINFVKDDLSLFLVSYLN